MRLTVDLAKINPLHDVRDKSKLAAITKDMIDNGWVGAPDAPPEQALYRIQQTYPDGSGSRLNVDWEGLLRLHDLIHDRIALEGRVCETCDTKGCHRPATWEIECRGAGVSGRLIYACDEHAPDEAILSPQDEIRRLVEK